MKKGIPIFFVHRGFNNMLYYSVGQVKSTNPDSQIYLLGDSDNKCLEKLGIKHIMLSDYFDSAQKFAECFVNMSPNKADYELFCFQRWFVLNSFIKKEDITEPFVYLDSDVLIYSDLTKWANENFNNYDITVCKKEGPQYTFCTSDVLNQFCEYIYDCYTVPAMKQKIVDKYEFYKTKHLYGGICDMKILKFFVQNKKVLDNNVIVNEALFDNNVSRSEGFKMENKRKTVKIEDGFAYGYTSDGRKIRFLGLHFQGIAKWHMYKYYTGDKNFVPSKFTAFLRLCNFNMQVFLWGIVKKLKLDGIKRIIRINAPRA